MQLASGLLISVVDLARLTAHKIDLISMIVQTLGATNHNDINALELKHHCRNPYFKCFQLTKTPHESAMQSSANTEKVPRSALVIKPSEELLYSTEHLAFSILFRHVLILTGPCFEQVSNGMGKWYLSSDSSQLSKRKRVLAHEFELISHYLVSGAFVKGSIITTASTASDRTLHAQAVTADTGPAAGRMDSSS